MSAGGRRLSDEERTLWSGVTRSVSPLHRPLLRAEPVVPSPKKAKEPAHPVHGRTPTPLSPAASPPTPPVASLGRRFRQEVARGKRGIDARIDLHGLTQAQAHHVLFGFLRSAQARGARVVLVITGKGASGGDHASERGVLRRQVPHWLRLPEFRALIVGFEAAAVGHGGEGALYVSLRRPRS